MSLLTAMFITHLSIAPFMICPKCGHETPDNELFCEECDFRMDQKYRKPVDRSQIIVYGSFAAAAFGIAAALSILLEGYIFGLVFGAIGMFLSSYTMTLTRMTGLKGNIRITLLSIQAIGLVTAAVGFIFGLVKAF